MNNASKGRCVTITPQGKSGKDISIHLRRANALCPFDVLQTYKMNTSQKNIIAQSVIILRIFYNYLTCFL